MVQVPLLKTYSCQCFQCYLCNFEKSHLFKEISAGSAPAVVLLLQVIHLANGCPFPGDSAIRKTSKDDAEMI